MIRRMLLAALLFSLALPTAALAASGPCLSQTLSRGSHASEVITLQKFLVAEGLLASDGATGYFGAMTEAAVQKWQAAHGPVSSGTAATTGFGSVGAKTRALLCKAVATTAPAAATPAVTPAAPPTVTPTTPAPSVATVEIPNGVGRPPNFQSFRAIPDAIDAPGESVLLSWTVFDALSCRLSGEDGTSIAAGRNTSDTYVVSPDKPTIYQLSCLGTGDSSTSTPMSATTTRRVNVLHTAPACEITLDKATYKIGEIIRISWTSTEAESASWSHDFRDAITMPYGMIQPTGQYFLTTNNLAYQSVTLSVVGRGGTGECSTTFNVTAPTASSRGFLSQLASLGVGLLYPPVRR